MRCFNVQFLQTIENSVVSSSITRRRGVIGFSNNITVKVMLHIENFRPDEHIWFGFDVRRNIPVAKLILPSYCEVFAIDENHHSAWLYVLWKRMWHLVSYSLEEYCLAGSGRHTDERRFHCLLEHRSQSFVNRHFERLICAPKRMCFRPGMGRLRLESVADEPRRHWRRARWCRGFRFGNGFRRIAGTDGADDSRKESLQPNLMGWASHSTFFRI